MADGFLEWVRESTSHVRAHAPRLPNVLACPPPRSRRWMEREPDYCTVLYLAGGGERECLP